MGGEIRNCQAVHSYNNFARRQCRSYGHTAVGFLGVRKVNKVCPGAEGWAYCRYGRSYGCRGQKEIKFSPLPIVAVIKG